MPLLRQDKLAVQNGGAGSGVYSLSREEVLP